MKKLGIAALVAAAALVGAPVASAGGPDLAGFGPCATVAEQFEDANVQVEPLPEPLGSTAGTVGRTVCGITG